MIEPAEPPHRHHHPTGIRWFDLLVPLAVIAVSIASLLTSSSEVDEGSRRAKQPPRECAINSTADV